MNFGSLISTSVHGDNNSICEKHYYLASGASVILDEIHINDEPVSLTSAGIIKLPQKWDAKGSLVVTTYPNGVSVLVFKCIFDEVWRTGNDITKLSANISTEMNKAKEAGDE